MAELDYFELMTAARRLAKEAKAAPPPASALRVALLSDAATQQITPLLRALFHRAGLDVVFYEGGFDAIELDAFNPASPLYGFKPDIVLLLNAIQSLRTRFYSRTLENLSWLEAEHTRHIRIWDALRQNTQALVLQSNYVLPHERFFGNFDHKAPHSFYAIVQKLNALLDESAANRNNVLINDVEAIASTVGRRTWFDERLWNMAKTFCAIEHLPLVANNIVQIVFATRGRGIKCIVLDLDNTLWGGIVGDEGALGIKIASHGDGEAFYHFQSWLRELKNRGILLAVCSKNEHAAAIGPFHENPEMLLKFEDITVFVANWNNKAENIRHIREQLNIGLDSLLFLDDNPFERNLVRDLVPEVHVPELPEDPADYVKYLSSLNLFETTAWTAEDASRTDLYKQENQRKQLETTAGNFEEYLQSLEMKIELSRFVPHHLERIAQLLQRSNQFNLTTRRHNQAQCESMMRDTQRFLSLYARLRDRFGDHGLISVVIAAPCPEESTLAITDWLMSCRVLTRGVEEYIMTHLIGEARARNLTRITGEYIPTAKNAMVKDFFARFGFVKTHEDPDGHSLWSLDVAAYQPKTVYLTLDRPAEAVTA